MFGKYYITCTGKTDGGGAQVHAVFSAMAYAHGTGIAYVHTPFKRISHNYNDAPDWQDKWENHFSLGRGEMTISQLDMPSLRVVPLTKDIRLMRLGSSTPTLLVARHCHWYAAKRPGIYDLIRPRLIRKYRSHIDVPYPRSDRVIIAVHVRRGDVDQTHSPERFTSDAIIAHQLNQIGDALGNVAHEIHLYSEGAPDDFASIGSRVILHLNEDIFQSIDAMIAADILVMARSSLSYVSAILSDGLKLFTPFKDYGPLADWVLSAQDGTIDPRALKNGIITVVEKQRTRRPVNCRAQKRARQDVLD